MISTVTSCCFSHLADIGGGRHRPSGCDHPPTARWHRHGHCHRHQPALWHTTGLWGTPCWILCLQGELPAHNSRPGGGSDTGRRGAVGVQTGTADPRATHPPRQGHQQHLHCPGQLGRRRKHVVENDNNNNVLFYVLFLRTGAHSPLQNKEWNTVKTNFPEHACASTHTQSIG